MKIGIVLFFALFFAISIVAVVVRLRQLCVKTNSKVQKLYDDKEYTNDECFSILQKRNEIVTEKDFKTYRDDVMALELP